MLAIVFYGTASVFLSVMIANARDPVSAVLEDEFPYLATYAKPTPTASSTTTILLSWPILFVTQKQPRQQPPLPEPAILPALAHGLGDEDQALDLDSYSIPGYYESSQTRPSPLSQPRALGIPAFGRVFYRLSSLLSTCSHWIKTMDLFMQRLVWMFPLPSTTPSVATTTTTTTTISRLLFQENSGRIRIWNRREKEEAKPKKSVHSPVAGYPTEYYDDYAEQFMTNFNKSGFCRTTSRHQETVTTKIAKGSTDSTDQLDWIDPSARPMHIPLAKP